MLNLKWRLANLFLFTSTLAFASPPPLKDVAKELTPLNIAYPAEGTILSAQVGLVFERTEVLRHHGFKAQAHAMGTGRELKTALVAGRADVILTSQTNFVVLVGNGFECFAINSLGSAGHLALVVPKNSPVHELRDLRHTHVATIYGTSLHEPALEWLKEAGEDVHVIDLSSQGAMNAALKTGTIGAMMTWDPFLTRGVNNGDYRVIKQRDFDLITVASKAFHSTPDAVARFNAATREALVYVSQHKSDVNRWFSELTKLDLKTIDEASSLNANYSAQSVQEVNLSISPRFREQLNREARFLFAQRSLARLPELGKFLE